MIASWRRVSMRHSLRSCRMDTRFTKSQKLQMLLTKILTTQPLYQGARGLFLLGHRSGRNQS